MAWDAWLIYAAAARVSPGGGWKLSDQIVQYADAVFSLHREKDGAGGSRTCVGLLKRRNYGRPAGEMLELVWEGPRSVGPHPPEHYYHLLRVPMTMAPLEPPPGSTSPGEAASGSVPACAKRERATRASCASHTRAPS